MDWCQENGTDCDFGLAGNDVLHAQVRAADDDLCVRRAEDGQEKAGLGPSFATPPRTGASSAASSPRGFDARYVVTILAGSAEIDTVRVFCYLAIRQANSTTAAPPAAAITEVTSPPPSASSTVM